MTISWEEISEKLEKLLETGSAIGEAATKVSEKYPSVDYATAWWIAGAFESNNTCKNEIMRKGADSLYENMVIACKKKLQQMGYQVCTEPSEISRMLAMLGGRGKPDILAVRQIPPDKDDILFIEIARREDKGFIAHQNYGAGSKCKRILLLPIDTSAVELWGLQNLVDGGYHRS
ncbi:hypothetical protein [Nitrososphaera sp.]|uniref:hypothetical protein n=1 Tax=Nitrososphaera sp. TaxID=1971748 RepID=UPI0017EEF0DC|nr:hypothetical protein [Nitrososphaera sp.]NWG36107.1 hypothetical protein [Nitrososphaera sp.]